MRNVAKLSRVYLSDEEVKRLSPQLERIFGFMEILNEADVEGLPETTQVTGLNNVMEKDEVRPSEVSREELLACSELPIDSKQIRVDRIVK